MTRHKRAAFLGAEVPALKHRAPLWADASMNEAHHMNVRLIDDAALELLENTRPNPRAV